MCVCVCVCVYFLVQVNTLGEGGTKVDGVTTYLTPELQPNTEYTFQILAINGFGDGVLSGTVSRRTNFGGTLQTS